MDSTQTGYTKKYEKFMKLEFADSRIQLEACLLLCGVNLII